MRPDVEKEHKEMFMDILNMKRQAIRQLTVKSQSLKFDRTARILPKVIKFINKLKNAYLNSKKMKTEHQNSLTKTKFFSFSHSDVVVDYNKEGNRTPSREPAGKFQVC